MFEKLRLKQKVRSLKEVKDTRKNEAGEKEEYVVVQVGELVTVTTIFDHAIQVLSEKSKGSTYFHSADEFELLTQDLAETTRAAMFGAFRAQGFHVEEIIRLAQAGLA